MMLTDMMWKVVEAHLEYGADIARLELEAGPVVVVVGEGVLWLVLELALRFLLALAVRQDQWKEIFRLCVRTVTKSAAQLYMGLVWRVDAGQVHIVLVLKEGPLAMAAELSEALAVQQNLLQRVNIGVVCQL